ncbi:hypothetical protein GCM10011395_35930 [Sphingomonas psychrolutea]|uniref:DUF417 family protein n=2 Tax=Sphingomonas psychrolutea TaxID=1259676 RepID=A0ABQ1H7K4_9SPHN|nr:hypothetical protein GCM10011395_35930 [Sphingomonas psychrolutea]
MHTGTLEMTNARAGLDPLAENLLRWTLVLVFLLFGTAKFAAYEAHGVAGIASNYWLFGWMYPLIGERGASAVIGTIELATGALLAIGARSLLASVAGAAMGCCTYLLTLSFTLEAPKLFEEGYGFPFLGSTGQFLIKDAVLLAACATLLLSTRARLAAVRGG